MILQVNYRQELKIKNSLDLPLNSILVSFDKIIMFPNIDNKSSVKKYLDFCSKTFLQPVVCQKLLNYALHVTTTFLIMGINYKQTAQLNDLTYHTLIQILLWQILIRKLQNIISVLQRGKGLGMTFLYFGQNVKNLQFYFKIISTQTQKIKFTMKVAEPGNYLEFLDLKLKWDNGKITMDVHSKPTICITQVSPMYCPLDAIPGKV